ncbi:hypothetical protein C5L14_27655 [Labrys okinawensis]|uniref:Carboxypeptidase regulatory-like domain-containing protein n=1 Tax=Labrys okinawensis TaxID=346911 RepID=A0A2S9Q4N3_9HYPH|nr:carboxypeptidase-like regulatory domain-containing protein [Labrys okinawensis]PRH84319.1 hypothetical protein C5L14_27655 [Labrys okinawensis]
MIGPRFALLATCLALAACRPAGLSALDRSSVTGVLLDEGRPVAGAQIRVTNSRLPSRSTLTSTDQRGRFSLSAGDAVSATPGADVLRIEANGEDYHAVGLVPAGSAALTCQIDASGTYAPNRQERFWSGNDIEWKPGQPVKALNCR